MYLCEPMDCNLPDTSVHGDSADKNTGVSAMPSSRDLPNSGTEPVSLMSPALAGRLFTTEPPGNPKRWVSLTWSLGFMVDFNC